MKSKSDASVVNTVLQCYEELGIAIDNMKLQKLLYFATARWALENDNDKLLDEDFTIWKYGPVLESAYHAFKKYGSRGIKKFVEYDGTIWVYKKNTAKYKCIDSICKVFQRSSGIDMSNITHAKDSPWAKGAYNDQIKFEDIINYFSSDENEELLY